MFPNKKWLRKRIRHICRVHTSALLLSHLSFFTFNEYHTMLRMCVSCRMSFIFMALCALRQGAFCSNFPTEIIFAFGKACCYSISSQQYGSVCRTDKMSKSRRFWRFELNETKIFTTSIQMLTFLEYFRFFSNKIRFPIQKIYSSHCYPNI